jgi:hypothetical protein
MTVLDIEPEREPVNLDRYAAELGAWRHDIRNACAHPLVPSGLNTHPKDRALFAHIASVLADYDRSKSTLTSANRP